MRYRSRSNCSIINHLLKFYRHGAYLIGIHCSKYKYVHIYVFSWSQITGQLFGRLRGTSAQLRQRTRFRIRVNLTTRYLLFYIEQALPFFLSLGLALWDCRNFTEMIFGQETGPRSRVDVDMVNIVSFRNLITTFLIIVSVKGARVEYINIFYSHSPWWTVDACVPA